MLQQAASSATPTMAPRKRRTGGGGNANDSVVAANASNSANGNRLSQTEQNLQQNSNSNNAAAAPAAAAAAEGPSCSKRNNNKFNADDIQLSEAEKLPLQKTIADFINGVEEELILEGLTNLHRKYLHKYVARIGLKSRSHGSPSNRVLVISRRKRLVTLGSEHKLELPLNSRRLLADMLPSLRSHLEATKKLQQQPPVNQQQKQSRLRGEALLLGLGPRMVPPRSQRIANDLYREKQELPVYRYQDELLQMLKKHPVSKDFGKY